MLVVDETQTERTASHGLSPGLNERLTEIASALRAVLAASEKPVTSAASVTRTFGVDRALGWRIWIVCTARRAEDAALHLPGEAALARFARYAARLGVPQETCDAVLDASLRFEAWVEDRVGDRTTLAMMLGPAADPDTPPEGSKPAFDSWRARLGHGATSAITTVAGVSGAHGVRIGLAHTLVDVQPLARNRDCLLADVGIATPNGALVEWKARTPNVEAPVLLWHTGPEETRRRVRFDDDGRRANVTHSETGVPGRCSLSLVWCWESSREDAEATLEQELVMPTARTALRVVRPADHGLTPSAFAASACDVLAARIHGTEPCVVPMPKDRPLPPGTPALFANRWHDRAATVLHELLTDTSPAEQTARPHSGRWALEYPQPGVELRFTATR